MLQCPSCDTTLDQDFGMVTCQNCGAVLIIEISGDVRISTNDENNNPDEPDEILEQEPDQEFHTDEQFEQNHETIQELQNEEESDDIEQFINEPSSEEISNDNNEFNNQNDFENHDNITSHESGFQEDGGFFESQPADMKENSHEIMEETGNTDTENQQETTVEELEEQDFFQEEEIKEDMESEEENTENVSSAPKPNSNPVDVTEFANSELSNMDDGEYLYDLTISHLDSKDLREALKEVLMDKKLKINHNDFLKKIKNGQVCIPNLNPVKAKTIVEQLQFYDLNIYWKQKRVVMEETLSEEEPSDDSDDVDPA